MAVPEGHAIVSFTVYHKGHTYTVNNTIKMIEAEDMLNHKLNSMLQGLKMKLDDLRRGH